MSTLYVSRFFLGHMVASVSLMLSACVSPQKSVDTMANIDPNLGYIGGKFFSKGPPASALVLIREGSTDEIVFTFASEWPNSMSYSEIGLLAIPPGTYRIVAWVVYSPIRAPRFRKDITDIAMNRSFVVNPKEVTFIGKLQADNQFERGMPSSNNFYIRVLPASAPELRSDFVRTYPKLSEMRFSCVFCVK